MSHRASTTAKTSNRLLKVLYISREKKNPSTNVMLFKDLAESKSFKTWGDSASGKQQRKNFDLVELSISDRLMSSSWLTSSDLTLIVAIQALSSQNKSVIFDTYLPHLKVRADFKLPAYVKHISAFVNLGGHWNRVPPGVDPRVAFEGRRQANPGTVGLRRMVPLQVQSTGRQPLEGGYSHGCPTAGRAQLWPHYGHAHVPRYQQ
jgi:hypothetical protein